MLLGRKTTVYLYASEVGDPVESIGICRYMINAMQLPTLVSQSANIIGAEKGLVLPSLTRWYLLACLVAGL